MQHSRRPELELYFEAEDIEAAAELLESSCKRLIHGLKEEPWSQRTIRLHDPDGHIVEVAEHLRSVAKRFTAEGIGIEEAAKRMHISPDTVAEMLRFQRGEEA